MLKYILISLLLLNLSFCEDLPEGTLEMIEDIYNFADKIYFKEGDISKIITNKSKFTKNHEGIVVRSNDINKDNWSFKVKSREYQLRG